MATGHFIKVMNKIIGSAVFLSFIILPSSITQWSKGSADAGFGDSGSIDAESRVSGSRPGCRARSRIWRSRELKLDLGSGVPKT